MQAARLWQDWSDPQAYLLIPYGPVSYACPKRYGLEHDILVLKKQTSLHMLCSTSPEPSLLITRRMEEEESSDQNIPLSHG